MQRKNVWRYQRGQQKP